MNPKTSKSKLKSKTEGSQINKSIQTALHLSFRPSFKNQVSKINLHNSSFMNQVSWIKFQNRRSSLTQSQTQFFGKQEKLSQCQMKNSLGTKYLWKNCHRLAFSKSTTWQLAQLNSLSADSEPLLTSHKEFKKNTQKWQCQFTQSFPKNQKYPYLGLSYNFSSWWDWFG